jgi:hypothetical protein
MDWKIFFGTLQVVIELDSNEPKVRTATNNFDQRDPDDKVIVFLTVPSWINVSVKYILSLFLG